jgi:hypothetical protein
MRAGWEIAESRSGGVGRFSPLKRWRLRLNLYQDGEDWRAQTVILSKYPGVANAKMFQFPS